MGKVEQIRCNVLDVIIVNGSVLRRVHSVSATVLRTCSTTFSRCAYIRPEVVNQNRYDRFRGTTSGSGRSNSRPKKDHTLHDIG